MKFLGNLPLLGAIQAGAGRTYWPQVGVEKVGCYPNRAEDRAPGRYIQLSGNVNNCLHIAFPKGFFDYQKQELARLRSRPPQPADSTDHKVFWALDVWARINWCLFSLNIPLGPYNVRTEGSLGRGDTPWWTGGFNGYGWAMAANPLLLRLNAKLETFNDGVQMQRDHRQRALDFEFMNQFIRERIQQAPTRPAPFMELVPQWYTTRGRSVNYSNNLRFTIERDCIPWMVGGDRLPSKGGKDNEFVQANANNPAVLRAVRQWRLWSMGPDYWPWSDYKDMLDDYDADDHVDYNRAPRFMGNADRRDTLEDYLRRVKSEPSGAEVVGTEGGWYPTLQYSIAYGLPALINVITATDYEATVREHVAAWAEAAKPPIDANGNVRTFDAGPRWGERPVATALTCEDFNDAVDGRKEAVEARMHAAIENPQEGCKDAPGYMEDACNKVNEFNVWVEEKIPVAGYIITLGRYLQHIAVWIGGAAEGVSGPSGMRVMHHPFTRNLADPMFSTAATGSSADVLRRVTNALFLIEEQLGLQLEPWTMGPPPPPARTQCDEQRADSRGVMRCVSTVAGDCYEVYFDKDGEAACLSRYTPQEWQQAFAVQQDPVKVCRELLDGYLAEQQATMSAPKRETALSMCQREIEGKLPPGTAANFVAEEVAAQKRSLDIPVAVVPSGPKIPWGLIALATVGVVLYRRAN